MRGSTLPLKSYAKVKDPRPVKREKYRPDGNAAETGYTRYARRSVYGAPGDFASPEEADRMDKVFADFPNDA